jgi:hypothetical protein
VVHRPQFVEERVERPTNPKIFLDHLLDLLLVGAEPVDSADNKVAALSVDRRQYDLKTLKACYGYHFRDAALRTSRRTGRRRGANAIVF